MHPRWFLCIHTNYSTGFILLKISSLAQSFQRGLKLIFMKQKKKKGNKRVCTMQPKQSFTHNMNFSHLNYCKTCIKSRSPEKKKKLLNFILFSFLSFYFLIRVHSFRLFTSSNKNKKKIFKASYIPFIIDET